MKRNTVIKVGKINATKLKLLLLRGYIVILSHGGSHA